jgi:predicted RNA binding protein YcfA (HicA-like mRNA interferase family)
MSTPNMRKILDIVRCVTYNVSNRGGAQNMTVRDIEKMLKKAGWYCERTKGGHKHFAHKDYNYVVTVPQHKGDIKTGTANSILKEAGLK